jgi:hypothetical protein
MFLLRIGSRGRWPAERGPAEPGLVDRAASDLTLRAGEANLSVFRVVTAEESEEVALRFALTGREEPRHVDYVVFPSELADALGLAVAHAPMDDLDPYLSERHHEIQGLTPEMSRQLARAILDDARWRVERLHKADLKPRGAERCRRDPELRGRLKGDWAKRLDDPETGG